MGGHSDDILQTKSPEKGFKVQLWNAAAKVSKKKSVEKKGSKAIEWS